MIKLLTLLFHDGVILAKVSNLLKRGSWGDVATASEG